MSDTNTTEIENKIYWVRYCPKEGCGREIRYTSELACEICEEAKRLCSKCSEPTKIPGKRLRSKNFETEIVEKGTPDTFLAVDQNKQFIRKCPTCGKNIKHKGKRSESSCRSAREKKRDCVFCAAKKRDNLVYEKGVEPTCSHKGCKMPESSKETISKKNKLNWNLKKEGEEIKKHFGENDCGCYKIIIDE